MRNFFSKLTNTYSIVAFDSENKQIGGAMQTHNFGACNSVIYAEPGVGVIASQAWSDPFYAHVGFEMIRLGRTATQALQGLVACDPDVQHNQVAIIDVKGNVAAHTGEKCIGEAGHIIGKTCSCQANIMLKDTVWGAMAAAFENSQGELIDRMMDAMEAAEGEGGDIRGAQSAVIKIVSSGQIEKPWQGRICDLRVYDSPEPLKELRRLVNTGRLHLQAIQAHNLLYEENIDDEEIALSMEQFNEAVSKIPNIDSKLQLQVQYALSLLDKGKEDEALPLFRQVFAIDPVWREMVMRVARVNPDKFYSQMLDRILSQ